GASDKGQEEARKSDRRRLLPLELEHLRVELGAGEEREHDGTDAGQELDPGLDSSVPSTADPMAAPMISCAMVPTTISDSAVEMRSQIESRLAIKARPSHSAASAQTLVMVLPGVVRVAEGRRSSGDGSGARPNRRHA